MSKESVSTDLIIKLPAVMTPETFTNEDEFEKLYAQVKEAVDKHIPDLTTKGGRDAIASTAYKVSRTKTALIAQGKKLTEGWRDQTKKVNAACNTIEERLDTLRDDVRKPLTEWEDAETARVAGLKARLEALVGLSKVGFGRTSADLAELYAEAEKTPMGVEHWEEFAPQAAVAREDALDTLKRLFATAKKQEDDALELERLRADAAERDRLEAERLAVEQLANQKRDYGKRMIQHIKQCAMGMIDGQVYPYPILFRELEEKVVADEACGDLAGDVEAARVEALQSLRAAQKADQERHAAERAEQERQAEEQRKADLAKAAEEASQRVERENAERVAAAERQAQEAQERADREIAAAKAETERLAEVERQRIAAAQEAEAAEQRRRDADRAHRKSVNNAIIAELVECAGITAEQGQKIVVHLVGGLVPNVTLKY